MKASEMVKFLKNLIKAHGDKDLIYASDDEGNNFGELYHYPSAGNFDGDGFITLGDLEAEDVEDRSEINAFCIN